MISLRNFLIAYAVVLISGLALIAGKDILMIMTQERFEAKVVSHVDAGEKKLYKPGSSYHEKQLAPLFSIMSKGSEERLQANYSCKDGCHTVGTTQTIYFNPDSKEFLVMTFNDFWDGPVYFLIVMIAFLLFSFGHVRAVNKPPVCELND